MKKYDRRLVGILGTVMIHLIAGILLMSFRIRSLQKDMSDKFTIEFATVDESKTVEKMIDLPATTVERILKGDDEMLNIARNLSNKSEEKINPADYIDKVKEELIKSGKLGINNYIDDQKRLNELNTDEKLASENVSAKSEEIQKPVESQEMAANYKGPTRIYYDLTGRTHTFLPIPIYKCQGSGRIVLSIEVNQKGIVEKAQIIANQSTTSDECLIETAVATALISRFNSDINFPGIQKGTLSYQFVAQ
jgi:hypothetical protein